MHYPNILKSLLALSGMLLLPLTIQAQELNPNYAYLIKGELIGRNISLGDPTNWGLWIPGREGESASGKVKVAPTSFKGEGDAIQITWSPKKMIHGSFALYGNPIDLSKFKDAVSLTIDMRIDVKPDKNVNVGLDCGYPCRADLSINALIKRMPKGKWFSLPLPLNCFKSDNFDLSKINSPFSIATDGNFKVSITNIRLEKLPEGEKSCVEK
ncbi:MAG TPA: glucan-glucohydrolase [Cellvibrio sp.]|nr:glucan-glucohydrolase [Cellvibrio sp.]